MTPLATIRADAQRLVAHMIQLGLITPPPRILTTEEAIREQRRLATLLCMRRMRQRKRKTANL